MTVSIIASDGLDDYEGITRTFYSHGNFVNISCSFYVNNYDLTKGSFITYVYSYDDTLIAQLRADENVFEYYDGSGWHEIADFLEEEVYYSFNMFINYEFNLAFIDFYVGTLFPYDDHVLNSSNVWSLYEIGKEGLGEVKFFGYGGPGVPGTDFQFMMDWVGVYVNGTSLSDEMAFVQSSFVSWNFQKSNIFEIVAEGNFTVGLSCHVHIPEVWYFGVLENEYIYDGSLKIRNYYNTTVIMYGIGPPADFDENVDDPFLVVYFWGANINFIISNITVHGVKLICDDVEYFPDFLYSGVNIDQNYFYADFLGRLCFEMNFSNDAVEYIQVNFDIPNFYTYNYAFSMSSQKTGNGFGKVGLIFTDTSNYFFDVKNYILSARNVLYMDKTVDFISCIATDNDELSLGYVNGYVTFISFTSSGGSLDMDLSGFLDIIGILVILLVPTLIVYFQTKKKMLIIPMLVLMSIVGFATSTIPTWLFFILLISFGGFFFLNRMRGDES